MRIKTVNIEPDVAAVIRAAKLDGNKLTLSGQLTAQMYKKVMKVLELIGFKWNRSAKCHIGEGDSAAKLTEALSVGTVVNEKQTYQFFETPTQVAAKIAALAGIKPGDRVLEPSAGKGAIIRAIQQECPQLAVVFACELNPQMASDLSTLAAASRIAGHGDVVVTCEDFLDHEEKYDRIVMNPPFTQDQAVRHVKHAYDLLNPGGGGWWRSCPPHGNTTRTASPRPSGTGSTIMPMLGGLPSRTCRPARSRRAAPTSPRSSW